MPSRLTVIMVHTPPAAAAASQMSEAVVGQLIGQPGIDLTLVGPLNGLAEKSTDRLSLESLTGDVAILDWRSADEIGTRWTELGLPGQRARHAGDPAAPPGDPTARKAFAFDLRQFPDAGKVIASLEALKSSQQVKTFALGLPTGNSAGARPEVANTPTTPGKSSSTQSSNAAPATPSKERSEGNRDLAATEASTPDRPSATGSLDLDALLDELDRSDP